MGIVLLEYCGGVRVYWSVKGPHESSHAQDHPTHTHTHERTLQRAQLKHNVSETARRGGGGELVSLHGRDCA
jgi:hypothetical protein